MVDFSIESTHIDITTQIPESTTANSQTDVGEADAHQASAQHQHRCNKTFLHLKFRKVQPQTLKLILVTQPHIKPTLIYPIFGNTNTPAI